MQSVLTSAERLLRGMTAPTAQNTGSIWTIKIACVPLFNGITILFNPTYGLDRIRIFMLNQGIYRRQFISFNCI